MNKYHSLRASALLALMVFAAPAVAGDKLHVVYHVADDEKAVFALNNIQTTSTVPAGRTRSISCWSPTVRP